jgi:hypothetical protein
MVPYISLLTFGGVWLLLRGVSIRPFAAGLQGGQPQLSCKIRQDTLHTAEILSGKNARAWVSMVLYLKK